MKKTTIKKIIIGSISALLVVILSIFLINFIKESNYKSPFEYITDKTTMNEVHKNLGEPSEVETGTGSGDCTDEYYKDLEFIGQKGTLEIRWSKSKYGSKDYIVYSRWYINMDDYNSVDDYKNAVNKTMDYFDKHYDRDNTDKTDYFSWRDEFTKDYISCSINNGNTEFEYRP